jgi:hypothetical protein
MACERHQNRMRKQPSVLLLLPDGISQGANECPTAAPTSGSMPPDIREDLIRLLAKMLVDDYQANQGVRGSMVKECGLLNQSPGAGKGEDVGESDGRYS